MGFYLAQAGAALYKVSASDGVATTLSLYSGVALDTTLRPRGAILGRMIAWVNSPNRSLWVDEANHVWPLVLSVPTSAPALAAGGGTGLTGAYRAKVTFLVKDDFGNILLESDFSPLSSASAALANNDLTYSNLPVSPDSIVNARRIYRTVSGPGTTYFLAFDVEDNVTTTISNGNSDESIALNVAPTDLGPAPSNRIELIAAWKDRLWAKILEYPDYVYFSGLRKPYAWPAANSYEIGPVGSDLHGVTGVIPRRDELGICRRDVLWKIIGDGPSNFTRIKVAEGVGCMAPDSIVVIRDTGHWLGEDGVYTWGPEGALCISRDTVHPWFTTDTYFNRAMFSQAVGLYNPRDDTYMLFLAAVGSTALDRWVSYDTRRKVWLGPHYADFKVVGIPTCAALLEDTNDLAMPSIGFSDGRIRKINQSGFSDDGAAIAFDVIGKFHSGEDPDLTHFWGELSMLTKVEAGGTLTITPTVGRLNAAAGAAISHTLTTGRQRLRRLGVGPLCSLRFQESTNAQGVTIYGYEIPFHELGRR